MLATSFDREPAPQPRLLTKRCQQAGANLPATNWNGRRTTMTGIDRIITVLRQAAAWVRHARAVARQRRALARINDPRILSDLGISEAQALFEVSRAPWDTDLESIMPPRPRLVREPLAANQRWMPRSRISSV